MSSAWTGQSGAPTRLLLLRHGQTVLSIDRRYSGHGDPELTTVGWAQAAGAAARLAGYHDITAVLTSPLRRPGRPPSRSRKPPAPRLRCGTA